MKILMINKFFYKRGGSEAYLFGLIDLLKKNGHQIMEFSMRDEKNEPSNYSHYFIKNIDFSKREGFLKDLKKALHLLYSWEAKSKLEALIKKERPAIAHLHNFTFQLTPSILSVLKKYNIPVVWTMHDYKLICPNYRLYTQGAICERCKARKYYNCFKYKCIKNSLSLSFLAMLEMYLHKIILKSYEKINLFIAPSRFLQNKLGEGWKINMQKVKQLYNFIDWEKFAPSQEIGEGLVYFGRLAEEKGILTLLQAMKDLPNIKLQIIGDGLQKEQINQYLKENNLANVKMLGYKSGPELYELIKKSRLVIMPSLWHENNPISIIEAFALAKPVIASNLGGLPELVKEGETGFLFAHKNSADLAKKIKDNYNNMGLIKMMGANCRSFSQANFNPQLHLENILQLYKSLLK